MRNAGIGVRHRAACVFGPISRLFHPELRSDQMESWRDALAEDNSDAMALKRCGYSFGDGFVGLDMFDVHFGISPRYWRFDRFSLIVANACDAFY